MIRHMRNAYEHQRHKWTTARGCALQGRLHAHKHGQYPNAARHKTLDLGKIEKLLHD